MRASVRVGGGFEGWRGDECRWEGVGAGVGGVCVCVCVFVFVCVCVCVCARARVCMCERQRGVCGWVIVGMGLGRCVYVCTCVLACVLVNQSLGFFLSSTRQTIYSKMSSSVRVAAVVRLTGAVFSVWFF